MRKPLFLMLAVILSACASSVQIQAPGAFDGLVPRNEEPGGPRLTAQRSCSALADYEMGVLVGVAAAGLLSVLGGLASVGQPDVAPEATVGLVAGGALVSATSITGGWAYRNASCSD